MGQPAPLFVWTLVLLMTQLVLRAQHADGASEHEPLPQPTISFSPDTTIHFREPVNITCSVSTGHQGGTFSLDGPVQDTQRASGGAATFSIPRVGYYHSGSYRCQYQTTVAGRSLTSAFSPAASLAVVDESVGIKLHSFPVGSADNHMNAEHTDLSHEPLPDPTVSFSPSKGIRFGEPVNIICSISTQPLHQGGTFTLDQQDGPFQETQTASGSSAVFGIPRVQLSHEGSYRCRFQVTISGRTLSSSYGPAERLPVDDNGMNIQVKHPFPASEIRLVGRRGRCAGRVELRLHGKWGTLCDDHWTMDEASVVCRQLGCGEALSAPKKACFDKGEGPIWRDFDCHGDEPTLTNCATRVARVSCDHDEDAGVVCSDAALMTPVFSLYHMPSSTPAQLPLFNGEQIKMECKTPSALCVNAEFHIYRNGELLTGFASVHESLGMTSLTTAGSGYQGSLHCQYTYTENQRLTSPESNTVQVLTVASSLLPDPSVSFSPSKIVRLGKSVDVTCSIVTPHQGGTFTLDQLNGPFQERVEARGTSATFTIPKVRYDHDGLYRCRYETKISGRSVASDYGQSLSLTVDDDGVNIQVTETSSDDGDIRLAGRSGRCAGRVEVKVSGKWGTLCDDHWSIEEASVVCRQLGCGAAVSAPKEACFGPGRGPIWRDFDCHGDETTLTKCTTRVATVSCNHGEDAGVVCSGAALMTPVLTVSPSKYKFRSGEDLRIDCDVPSNLCVKATFRIYRKGELYTSHDIGHSNIGFNSRTTVDKSKAGAYTCDYTYTENQRLTSARSGAVSIAVVERWLFSDYTYT
ncbi:hypothetical protein ACEWY4_026435 [Coilia grayii]|uniref:Deleted in malignant brain tumors 1 protein-like n=1 Tax=Coilia grayii TaxID=363190 RepID=A0ABD1IXM1_9TELE